MKKRTAEAGFTLIEVIIAVVMLAILTLSLMKNNATMIRAVTDDRARTQAMAAADERLARVRVWPTYATLEATFAGTENNTPFAGWSRVTTIVRTGGVNQVNDYKRITISVTGPGLAAAINRTVTLAAP
ncbi:MAG: prepilin-type N-terminal cleavage/methylation domain-containing protein [Gemmatimonadales bacterium]|nr:prepilin-type N-terminal cleavage/methylation domain-containing protein [Gemmatimonadales bacterium]